MTPLGIEPAAVKLVAQCLDKLSHRVPRVFRDLMTVSYFVVIF
jgi:hypothetical protein